MKIDLTDDQLRTAINGLEAAASKFDDYAQNIVNLRIAAQFERQAAQSRELAAILQEALDGEA